MHSSRAALRRSAVMLVVALGVTACGVDKQEMPSLIGPSGFAQSVTLSASPDRLPRDGSSQSVITVTVRNDVGQGVSGQRVTVGSSAGTVSQSEVVTGNDGRATFTLTAPAAGAIGDIIDVFATPVGGDFTNAITRSLSIGILGISNTTVPIPSFTVTPSSPEVQQVVTFDATGTIDEGSACGTSCTYAWTFSDGIVRTGQIVTRTFTTPGSYTATLSVTDAAGASASTTQTVAVASVPAPLITAPTMSPAPAVQGRQVTFFVDATPASGHHIAQYLWNFGDSTTQVTTVPTVIKTYTAAGTFTTTVTVSDDLGQVASAAIGITVIAADVGQPVARFTVTPSQPRLGEQASFDASGTTVGTGSVLTTYIWTFGDGTSEVTSTPTTQKTYDEARIYPVTLTVVDNLGRTSTAGQQVTVVP